MRVVHVIKTDGIAGAETHLLTLLPELAGRGVDVCVLFIAPDSGAGADFAAAVEAQGIPIDRVPIRGHGSPALIPALVRVLRSLKADLVHVHLFHAEIWGIPAARLAGIPRVIVTRHNEDPRRARFPLSVLYRAIWPMISAGICISDAVRRAVIAEGAPASKLRVIHYGLPPRSAEAVKPARTALRDRLEIAPEAFVAGTVSRLIALKGIDDAIRATAGVPGAHLAIVGDGPERESLEALAASLGVTERVHFLGWLSPVAPILAGMDGLLAPSHREGFGLSVLEAMQQAVPVIASTAGALPEIVVDGYTGLLVPPRDPEALAQALSALAGSAHLRKAMGAAGQARAEAEFSAGRMVDATLALYHELGSREAVE